jgi:glutamate racemase
LEIKKLFPDIVAVGEACPIWVPLVENGEAQSEGADYFIRRHINNLLDKDDKIDTIILGCTHYPILYNKIRQYTPTHIKVVTQGEYVAKSLANYLERHPEMDALCTKEGICRFLTTESVDIFKQHASIFFEEEIQVKSISLK